MREKMTLLTLLLACTTDKDSGGEPVCVFYNHCCVAYCEPEDERTHAEGESDPCMCEQDTAHPTEDQCQLVDEVCTIVE